MITEQNDIISQLIKANYNANNTANNYYERDIARQKYYNLKRQLISLIK